MNRNIAYLQAGEKGTSFLLQSSGEFVLEPAAIEAELSAALRQYLLANSQTEKPFRFSGRVMRISYRSAMCRLQAGPM